MDTITQMLCDWIKCSGRWLEELWRAITDSPIEPPYDAEWSADDEWYMKYRPKGGLNYLELREYSRRLYDDISKVHDTIDDKSDKLFAIGVAVIGATVSANLAFGLSLGWSIPCLACVAISIFLCLKTRVPMGRPTPMSAKSAFERHENTETPDAWIAASLHCATLGFRKVIEWKAVHLTKAAQMLLAGAVLFVLPLTFSPEHTVPSESRHKNSELSRLKGEVEVEFQKSGKFLEGAAEPRPLDQK